jgi:hypothetical protein
MHVVGIVEIKKGCECCDEVKVNSPARANIYIKEDVVYT